MEKTTNEKTHKRNTTQWKNHPNGKNFKGNKPHVKNLTGGKKNKNHTSDKLHKGKIPQWNAPPPMDHPRPAQEFNLCIPSGFEIMTPSPCNCEF